MWEKAAVVFRSLFYRDAFLSAFSKAWPFKWFEYIELVLVISLASLVLYLVYRQQRKIDLNTEKLTGSSKKSFLKLLLTDLIVPVALWLIGFFGGIAWLFFFKSIGIWFLFLTLSAPWIALLRIASRLLQMTWPDRWDESLDRLFTILIGVWYLCWMTGLSDLIIKYLSLMSVPLGSGEISVFDIISGLIWVAIIIIVMLWIARFLEKYIMSLKTVDLNLRFVIIKLMKSIAVVMSILVALPMVGINLTVLSVFGGAIGVGIGFGLQTIASNYVSGFIILLDRSIRVGDRLTVNDFVGHVVKITSRFVVLRDPSGKEALIPNETFISQPVYNDSFGFPSFRRSVVVGVAYATDLDKARSVMNDIAKHHPRVDMSYPVDTLILDFADSSINLEVRFWIRSSEAMIARIESDIRYEIWKRFKEEGIEFPFPQREVKILN